MDRRSWLWRRKSSEKSPSGETESSGSLSSHSERFSDDQTTLSNQNTQSPEFTSKAAPDDELNDGVNKTLSEKLSEALVEIQNKEDLVKQHAKVAEEAVSGWERAENEVLVLKKQIDSLTQQNSILEERVGHLDGALKECLRQLRQAREEQEDKIHDALARRSSEWESAKSKLENQLNDLCFQLQNAKTESTEARSKLEAAEKENSILKFKLLSKDEELELRSHERDLSTHAAENASKHHLDSIKKVAKLEAECRRLKAMVRKATADSLTDSQSDIGERMLVIENESYKTSGFDSVDSDSWAVATEMRQIKNERALGRSIIVPSVGIGLMDDFLEMERLAALPDTNSGTGRGENPTRDELEIMINRTVELEEKLKKTEAEKLNFEIALNECQIQLKTSEHLLKQAELKLVDASAQLVMANEAKRGAEITELDFKKSKKLLEEAEVNMVRIRNQLKNVNEGKSVVELELKDANARKAEAESKLKVMEIELENLCSEIRKLEKEVGKERNLSREARVKCETLESEILRMKSESQFQRSAIVEEFRINQDKELAVAASKFAECQKTIASLGRQLESLATLDDFLIDADTSIAVL